ncbi:MAG TPA: PhoPQ-activated pathogenicity-related family protein [Blastocatellia bacterium]|nr:PhoPQ-activated pathogenicity-related family protein [Blastocatellia bacterium]HMV85455.1 PhoPQ-activated pathogenicity-related family protein [Blastocatellia bacterium]HMX26925.1 PhoPQ-activated pathogenicity-related family protein [Blastocatellia bacterium]HMY70809.1 PhoPQ-activated pathogenicity-related family protein [Blastocatellia bacterium]HMZ17287.1 PhoPQ-activated pathogenicity-related family protein [Blastocatellia bacterium]
MKHSLIRTGSLCCLLIGLAFFAPAQKAPQQTALDRYIAQPDSVYGWKLVNTIEGAGYRGYVLELTSQTWRSEKDVDRPVWKHWLTIVKPEKVVGNKALLFIGGGKNGDPAPSKVSDRAAKIAVDTNSVVADLGMVPNQPLYFTDSKDKGRSEDDLIAYTRVKHFTTKDDFWLVRLAMVKSGVRAMDAIQEFLRSDAGGKLNVEQFVVAGGSKRGWTTWLVGAVDKRVVAIMPMVIDALNSEAITKHHFEAYGFFSPSLNDYVNHGLFPHKIGTPEYKAVLDVEDPYNYRRRDSLKMPKFMINAAGDQFFLPDNSQFYYGELPEEKHIRYVPNAKHDLAGSDAVDSLTAFYQAILTNTPRPRFSWKKEKDGSLVVRPVDKPKEVNLWQATNPNTRDFRLDLIGKAYTSSPLKAEKDGSYVGRVTKPEKGYTAFFVELVYDSGGKYPFKFTTQVSVVPDVLPYKFEDAAKKYAGTASRK